MKLVSLVCLCLVTRCGITAAGVNGPEVVEEGSDVILPCSLSTKEDIQSELFDWVKDGRNEDRDVFMYDKGHHYNNGRPGQSEQFKGRVFHFPDQLKFGNASIIIRNTKVPDQGNYSCIFPHLQPNQIFRVELIVRASPKPSIIILRPTDDGELLQCEVRGSSPEPRLHWQDSSGNILIPDIPQVSEEGGRYIALQVTVTKTDYYRCVATQEIIKHQIYTETYVSVPPKGERSEGNSEYGLTGIIVAVVVSVIVTLVVVGVVHLCKDRIQRFCKKGSSRESRTRVSGEDSS